MRGIFRSIGYILWLCVLLPSSTKLNVDLELLKIIRAPQKPNTVILKRVLIKDTKALKNSEFHLEWDTSTSGTRWVR